MFIFFFEKLRKLGKALKTWYISYIPHKNKNVFFTLIFFYCFLIDKSNKLPFEKIGFAATIIAEHVTISTKNISFISILLKSEIIVISVKTKLKNLI